MNQSLILIGTMGKLQATAPASAAESKTRAILYGVGLMVAQPPLPGARKGSWFIDYWEI
jgi:hypothetical protein